MVFVLLLVACLLCIWESMVMLQEGLTLIPIAILGVSVVTAMLCVPNIF